MKNKENVIQRIYKGKEEISGTLERCRCTHHPTFLAKYCLYIS